MKNTTKIRRVAAGVLAAAAIAVPAGVTVSAASAAAVPVAGPCLYYHTTECR